MSPIVIILLVALAAGGAAGIYFYARPRRAKEEPVYYFQCPQCGRKLRYRLRQAGHKGACPRCKSGISFPEAPAKVKHGK
jgi:hypothetical protein